MKNTILQGLLALFLAAPAAMAAENHAHKTIPGPQGGRMLECAPLHAEFFVRPDRKISVTFYDESLKPVAPSSEEVKAVAETKAGKTAFEFEKAGGAFVSKTPLPAGDGYRVVLLIKSGAAAKSRNFRIDYQESVCGGCKRAEYACICGH